MQMPVAGPAPRSEHSAVWDPEARLVSAWVTCSRGKNRSPGKWRVRDKRLATNGKKEGRLIDS